MCALCELATLFSLVGSGPMGGGGGGRWMSTRRWARRGLSEQPTDLLLESKLVGFSTPLLIGFF